MEVILLDNIGKLGYLGEFVFHACLFRDNLITTNFQTCASHFGLG